MLTPKQLAEKDKRVSLIWARFAVQSLEGLWSWMEGHGRPATVTRKALPPAYFKVYDGLQTHFKIGDAANTCTHVEYILVVYRDVVRILNASTTYFVDDPGSVAPAHVPFGSGKIHFTSLFKEYDPKTGTGFGPFCRAAMVLHEPVHIADHPDASQAPNHVYEWGSAYAGQTAEQAKHNASAYAAYAQQMNFGRDTRYGAGRPRE